jgi:hypothetical protein
MNVHLNSYIHLHHFNATGLVLLVLVLLAVLAFELWMLIDVLAYRKMPTAHRVWWVVLMFLIHPIVAIVYFFARGNYKKVK